MIRKFRQLPRFSRKVRKGMNIAADARAKKTKVLFPGRSYWIANNHATRTTEFLLELSNDLSRLSLLIRRKRSSTRVFFTSGGDSLTQRNLNVIRAFTDSRVS
jgi:hypothetical protein